MTLTHKINEILYPNKADMMVFGCLVKAKSGTIYTVITKPKGKEYAYVFDEKDRESFKLDFVFIVDILGKPIMLDDLLMAIIKLSKTFTTINNPNGHLTIIVNALQDDRFVFTWQLGKQLTEQSQETQDKLNTIFNDKI